MKYLTVQDILVIHAKIIDATLGSHGVRDTHLLASIAEKPKMAIGGEDLYAGVFVKAAVYLESVVNYHVFIDGNKRTAFAVAVRFLDLQGYTCEFTRHEVVETMVGVVEGKYSMEEIALWLQKHSTQKGNTAG